MKFSKPALAALTCLAVQILSAHEMQTAKDEDGAVYEYTPGDPFGLRIYTLKNGLRLYLARNTEAPKIQSYIAVRAGSVNDPENSTGLAHYFEHLMFKGSAKIAALDWAKEKPLLDRLEALFEQYRAEKDPAVRARIYAEIDRVSGEAGKLANDEYWEILRNMGVSGTNAFTSDESTGYMGDLPANMLERFLTLEAERFSNISLRRFHTELETVYEEYNRSQDNDTRLMLGKLNRVLYPAHPLGRPVIGLPEHLKNPSIRDLGIFFKTYYVPENMALILIGDLDFEKARAAAENTFEKLPKGKLPRPEMPKLDPYPQQERTIHAGDSATPPQLVMAFRFPRDRRDNALLDAVLSVLQNGRCGVFDTDLIQTQKVQTLQTFDMSNNSDAIVAVFGRPAAGQTLEQLRALILDGIAKVQRGDFPAWLVSAYANNERIQLAHGAEKRALTARYAFELFVQDLTPAQPLNDLERLDRITPAEVAAFAQKNFVHPVTVTKGTGTPKHVYVEKPAITPVPLGTAPSPFSAELSAVPAGPEPEIETLDLEKSLTKTALPRGYTLYSTRNERNERFSLRLVFPVGNWHDRMLPILFLYAEMIGTEKHSLGEFNQELYKLAVSLSFNVGTHASSITISGIQRNFPAALALLEERLTLLQNDPDAWKKLVSRIRREREQNNAELRGRFSAECLYAMYGKNNASLNNPSSAELANMDPAKLTAEFRALASLPHDFTYFGPADPKDIAAQIGARPALSPEECRPLPAPHLYKITPVTENTVILCDYPGAAQTLVQLYRADEVAIPGRLDLQRIFSAVLGSLFFTELREKQGLGYVADGGYTIPGIQPDNYAVFDAVLGTQPDKLVSGMRSMLAIANDPGVRPEHFTAAKNYVLGKMRSIWTQPESRYSTWRRSQRMKQPADFEQTVYRSLEKMDFDTLKSELKKHTREKPDLWVVIGDLKRIDVKALEPFGKIVVVPADDIMLK